MIVDEPVMRPGRFDLRLRPGAPPSLIRWLREATDQRDGFIYVYPTRTPEPDVHQSAALWVGVMAEDNGANGFGGFGLAGLLGTDDARAFGRGDKNLQISGSAPLADWIAFAIVDESAIAADRRRASGIKVGTVDTTGLSATLSNFTRVYGLTPREQLDDVLSRAGGGWWRLNPDATLDVATRDRLFAAADRLIVLDEVGESGGRPLAVTIPDYRKNSGQLAAVIHAFGAETGGTDALGGGTLTLFHAESAQIGDDEDGIVSNALGWRLNEGPSAGDSRLALGGVGFVIDAPGVDSTAELQNYADAAAARFRQAEPSFGLVTNDPGVRRRHMPGDACYIHSERYNIRGTELVDAGSVGPVYPVEHIIHRMRWGVHEGMGVGVHRWGRTPLLLGPGNIDEWRDITPFVEVSPPRCEWSLGTGPGPAGTTLEVGPDRLGETPLHSRSVRQA